MILILLKLNINSFVKFRVHNTCKYPHFTSLLASKYCRLYAILFYRPFLRNRENSEKTIIIKKFITKLHFFLVDNNLEYSFYLLNSSFE